LATIHASWVLHTHTHTHTQHKPYLSAYYYFLLFRLHSYEDVSHLAECKSITILDLSNNKLEDHKILEILEEMPNLAVLNLSGNVVISQIDHYRKIMVSTLKSLTYLDDRPIFPHERRACEAWRRGGHEAEVAERELIKQEDRDHDRRNFEALERLQQGLDDNMHDYSMLSAENKTSGNRVHVSDNEVNTKSDETAVVAPSRNIEISTGNNSETPIGNNILFELTNRKMIPNSENVGNVFVTELESEEYEDKPE